MSTSIDERMLSPRHIKAGLHVSTDGEFIYLTTKGEKRIGIYMMHTDSEFIKNEANKYLKEIDWQK